MATKKLFDLPIPQSGCGDTHLGSNGTEAILRFEFRSHGKDLIGMIHFHGLVAYRYRDERHSLGYPSEAYEAVTELNDSEWCRELNFSGKHIGVFLSSNGFFEFLADSVTLGDSVEGRLPNVQLT